MTDRFVSPKCGYTREGDHIVTDGSVRNKMTGTALAGIRGVSHWDTPFTVSCRLLGLAEKDLSGKRAIVIGKELESKLIEYAAERYREYGRFVPAEELFAQRTGEHSSWSSDFDDPYFAGHLDGMVFDDDGESYVLEVKTTSNIADWENGVPEYYFWQVALYNHFMCQKDHAFVLLGMVDKDTQRNTEAFVPNDRTVALYVLDIDREMVAKELDWYREWYDAYIAEARTPDADTDDRRDAEVMDHLTTIASDIAEMRKLVKYEKTIRDRIEAKESEIKADLALRKEVDERIKDYMVAHDLTMLFPEDEDGGYVATIRRSVRSEISPDLLRADGIQPEIYTVQKESVAFTVKQFKKKNRGDQK